MSDDVEDQTELKTLLRECAEALEKRDIETAMRLWRQILTHEPLRGASRH